MKTIVVTGGSSGLGLETCKIIASSDVENWSIHLPLRSVSNETSLAAVDSIREIASQHGSVVESYGKKEIGVFNFFIFYIVVFINNSFVKMLINSLRFSFAK